MPPEEVAIEEEGITYGTLRLADGGPCWITPGTRGTYAELFCGIFMVPTTQGSLDSILYPDPMPVAQTVGKGLNGATTEPNRAEV